MYFHRLRLAFLSVVLLLEVLTTAGQQTDPSDNLKINTDLVRTDVGVFDKSGKPVLGLERDQFKVTVEGRDQSISFFERLTIGTEDEKLHWTTATGAKPDVAAPSRLTPGRTIIFFVDDLHLSPTSLVQTRSSIEHFLASEIEPGDSVAIASSSGIVGFLQQFSSNLSMLRAAVKRLVYRPYNSREMTRESSPMSEYAALSIEKGDDAGLFRFYVEECRLAAPLNYPVESCEVEVKNRARLILQQAASVTVSSFGSLESLVNVAGRMPGRKLAFFFSDGFLIDVGARSAPVDTGLKRIIDKARRAGVVVFTIDARGLITSTLDAINKPVDPNGRLERAQLGEVLATQDGLNALAADTGGRALFNQNTFSHWMDEVLTETSNYYLLAWMPDDADLKAESFRNIKVTIVGHPEYSVRVSKGFSSKPEQADVAKKPVDPGKPPSPAAQVSAALTSATPTYGVPLNLSAIYLDTPGNGLVITASVEIGNDSLQYKDGKAAVDVAGVLLDDKGKQAGTFQTRLTVAEGDPSRATATLYNHRFQPKPGLYQLRVAARDTASGTLGADAVWIELPDLASKQPALSSILAGVARVAAAQGTPAGAPQMQFNIDHHFHRGAGVPLFLFLYNPSADVNIQAVIGTQDGSLSSAMLREVKLDPADPGRIPYGGNISLARVPPGRYTLRVTASDRAGSVQAVQEMGIVVE